MGAFHRIHRLGVMLIFLLLVPGVASAHEISGQFEAPLPLTLLFSGAAMTVGVTALMLAFTVEEPLADAILEPRFSISPSVAAGLRVTARGLFFLAFVLTLVTGLLGRQVQAENFATIFVWAVWLKGIALIAAITGSPWRVLSPWRALYDMLSRLERRPIAVLGDYPSWLGVGPALIGYLFWIGIIENLTVIPRSPNSTVLLLIGYTIVMLVGGLLFGPEWFRKADVLSVLYRLFGRVSPVYATRTETGGYRIEFRGPWQGCTRSVYGLAVAGFVIATVYTVSFDGFTSTPEYQTILLEVQRMFDVGPTVAVLLYLVGFLGFIAAFAVTIVLTRWLADEPSSDWRRTAFAFAPTVLPIAVAYEIAHNYPFVLANAGQLPATLWPFFGLGRKPTFDLLWWLTVSAFWWSQVILIVVGHIVAVVAAHYVALSRYETTRKARRAHGPLVVLMIGYTVLSLWIISRPVVTG